MIYFFFIYSICPKNRCKDLYYYICALCDQCNQFKHIIRIIFLIFSSSLKLKFDYNQMSSAFKKKAQVPENIPQLTQKLNMLLGLGSHTNIAQTSNQGKLTKNLILACASFWDSKQRIDKIKSLILKEQGLIQFDDTQDFKVDDLMSIELLSLSKNKIIHLHPLSHLDTLLCLNINNNKVYDIEPLRELNKLEELYAANNQINLIDALGGLQKLHILNLYNNKISRLEESVKILSTLPELEELDIELNPIYSVASRSKFVNLQKIVRLNGDLILQDEKDDDGPMSSSCIVIPSAKFRDTHTSFFNSASKKKTMIEEQRVPSSHSSRNSGKKQRNNQQYKRQLQKKLNQLEQKYFALDDKFEEQIVRNVQLKSEFHQKNVLKREIERKKQDNEEKAAEIKLLKRKVKAMKENLFGNPEENNKKGELLRQLFQLEMMNDKKQKTNKNKQQSKKEQLWVRKFDFDEEIVIGEDQKYLTQEDEEIAMLLSSNTSALQQLKRELREMAIE